MLDKWRKKTALLYNFIINVVSSPSLNQNSEYDLFGIHPVIRGQATKYYIYPVSIVQALGYCSHMVSIVQFSM